VLVSPYISSFNEFKLTVMEKEKLNLLAEILEQDRRKILRKMLWRISPLFVLAEGLLYLCNNQFHQLVEGIFKIDPAGFGYFAVALVLVALYILTAFPTTMVLCYLFNEKYQMLTEAINEASKD